MTAANGLGEGCGACQDLRLRSAHGKIFQCLSIKINGLCRECGGYTGRDRGGLHQVLHHICTDFVAHLLADLGREAVVEAGPDARFGNFVGESSYVRPMVDNARRSRTLDRNIRNLRRAERRLHDAGEAGAFDAMRTWIFRMHGRDIDRLPTSVALGGRIVVVRPPSSLISL